MVLPAFVTVAMTRSWRRRNFTSPPRRVGPSGLRSSLALRQCCDGAQQKARGCAPARLPSRSIGKIERATGLSLYSGDGHDHIDGSSGCIALGRSPSVEAARHLDQPAASSPPWAASTPRYRDWQESAGASATA